MARIISQGDAQVFEYTLVRSRRKTLGLQAKDGKLIVRAPLMMPEFAIKAALLKNSAKIKKMLEKSAAAAAAVPKSSADALTEEELKELKKKAKAYIPGRVAHYASLLGVSYGTIAIRAQHTRWGSCSSKGNLNFNCLLMLTDESIIDSVVAHEVCHLKHMNHSKAFYADVIRIFPDYRRCEKWLKANGSAIMARNPT